MKSEVKGTATSKWLGNTGLVVTKEADCQTCRTISLSLERKGHQVAKTQQKVSLNRVIISKLDFRLGAGYPLYFCCFPQAAHKISAESLILKREKNEKSILFLSLSATSYGVSATLFVNSQTHGIKGKVVYFLPQINFTPSFVGYANNS